MPDRYPSLSSKLSPIALMLSLLASSSFALSEDSPILLGKEAKERFQRLNEGIHSRSIEGPEGSQEKIIELATSKANQLLTDRKKAIDGGEYFELPFSTDLVVGNETTCARKRRLLIGESKLIRCLLRANCSSTPALTKNNHTEIIPLAGGVLGFVVGETNVGDLLVDHVCYPTR